MVFYEETKELLELIINDEVVSNFIVEMLNKSVVLVGGLLLNPAKKMFNENDSKDGKVEANLYNKIGINFWWNQFLKIIILGTELFSIAFYYIVLIILAGVAMLCLNIRLLVDSHLVAVWVIVVIFSTIPFIYKRVKGNLTIWKKLLLICLVTIGCIWSAIQITLIKYNEVVLMSVMVAISLVLTIKYALKWNKTLAENYYKNIVLKWIRCARYCIIPCVALNAVVTTGTGLVDELVDLWIVLWCVEYIWNVWLLKIDKTEVVVEINGEDIKTVNSVVEYANGRIKYITLDKKEVVVKKEYVHRINYQEEFHWIKKKEKIFCLLEETDLSLEFDSYKRVSNDWTKFFVYEKGVRKVTLIKNKDIKMITTEGK